MPPGGPGPGKAGNLQGGSGVSGLLRLHSTVFAAVGSMDTHTTEDSLTAFKFRLRRAKARKQKIKKRVKIKLAKKKSR